MSLDLLHIRYPKRSLRWMLRTRTLELSERPLLMGIVNATPDSFSDGGKFYDPAAAIAQAIRLAEEGADVIDIGGESTRPYSQGIDLAEELRRTESVVRETCKRVSIPVSIDTSKAEVARVALEAGAEIVNDVTAMTGDPLMTEVVRSAGAGVCLMHMQGTPQTMQDTPTYRDVTQEIAGYLSERSAAAITAGIERDRICLDPGVGFGKTHDHNLELCSRVEMLHELGFPLLVGHSRKGFIGKVLGDASADRDAGTLGAALALARQGIQIIRVHEVSRLREALKLFAALGGIDGRRLRLP